MLQLANTIMLGVLLYYTVIREKRETEADGIVSMHRAANELLRSYRIQVSDWNPDDLADAKRISLELGKAVQSIEAQGQRVSPVTLAMYLPESVREKIVFSAEPSMTKPTKGTR